MSKFNTASVTIKTVNNEDHKAYTMPEKSKLITQILTSFFNEDKFYGDNSADIQETIRSVIKNDPAFVSNLAVYARREFNMRSVSHVLTAYLAHENEGKPYVRKTIKGITVRGDDITELLSFYLSVFGKPIPNALRKGINDVFITFDEYTLAKYKGSRKSLKMRDVIMLCHPAPKTDKQSEMWKRCLEGKLETPVTWETQLSANGNNAKTWEMLIDSGKVGYMALLRNLRNIIAANPSNIGKIYKTIEDPERVTQSKQLPFRFLSAYKSVSGIAGSRALTVLEKAASYSLNNMPKIPGRTVIAVDISGSMSSPISAGSDIKCGDIAVLLGLAANKMCEDSLFYAFNSELCKVAVSENTPILETASQYHFIGGTRMELPFVFMTQNKIQADRIIILSDNECNGYQRSTVQHFADEYRKSVNKDLWVHAIDLQGYGTQQFCGARTNIIAGWSEKVLDFIMLAEQGEGSLEKTISNYSF